MYEPAPESKRVQMKHQAEMAHYQRILRSKFFDQDTTVPIPSLPTATLLSRLKDLTTKTKNFQENSSEKCSNSNSSRSQAARLSYWEICMLQVLGECGNAKVVAQKLHTSPDHIYQRLNLIRKKISKSKTFLDVITDLCKVSPKLRKYLDFPLPLNSSG
jgi:hypothetical protein